MPETPNAPEPGQVAARPLADLERHKDGSDPDELLRHRYLCRGGGLLLVGPTGVGKSSLSLQLAIQWALGLECFGIEPARPLTSLIIQAENDDGDVAEMRDGVIKGLGLSESDAKTACESIYVWREDSRSGIDFFKEVVLKLLKDQQVDLIWIDPVLAFLKGEASSQKDVSTFLRNQLNPVLRALKCGGILLHHTNKPPSGNNKREWSGSDNAYLGSGSIEWANWPRGVLALRGTSSRGVFELVAGKRGGRLGWRSDDDLETLSKLISHSKESGEICWREADDDETPKKGRPKSLDAEEIYNLLPLDGLSAGEWKLKSTEVLSISESTFHRLRRNLRTQERIKLDSETKRWIPLISL
jgi:hypothetical protein